MNTSVSNLYFLMSQCVMRLKQQSEKGSFMETPSVSNSESPSPPNSNLAMLESPHHLNLNDTQPPVKSLKFSIEKILSPEFGGLQPNQPIPASLNSNHKNHHQNGHAKGIHSPVNHIKRKHPSGSSLSSYTSSISASEDININCNTNSQSPKTTNLNESSPNKKCDKNGDKKDDNGLVWPAWVYCTRYSDRPSSVIKRARLAEGTSAGLDTSCPNEGPRSRKIKKKEKKADEKRPRTAFTAEQLARLKQEFVENRYLTEKRRQDLARDLKLNESQIKIWFQNKRAKIKKTSGPRNPLAMHLMAQGLYNHSTVATDGDSDDDEMIDMGSPLSDHSSMMSEQNNS